MLISVSFSVTEAFSYLICWKEWRDDGATCGQHLCVILQVWAECYSTALPQMCLAVGVFGGGDGFSCIMNQVF